MAEKAEKAETAVVAEIAEVAVPRPVVSVVLRQALVRKEEWVSLALETFGMMAASLVVWLIPQLVVLHCQACRG